MRLIWKLRIEEVGEAAWNEMMHGRLLGAWHSKTCMVGALAGASPVSYY